MEDDLNKTEVRGAVLEVRRVGDSLAVLLTDRAADVLHVKEGDRVRIVEASDLSLTLSRHDPVHAKGMAIAREAFKTYSNTFKALAK